MQFQYRKARTKDILQLSLLLKMVYLDTYGLQGISLEFAEYADSQFSINKITSDFNSVEVEIWLACHKGNPVGVLQLEYDRESPEESLIAPEVNKLYVLRRFFGLGIAQGLMREAHKELQCRGYKKSWLWVLISNDRAIRFYERQGYRSIGTAYFQMAENKYNNLVMTKVL